MISILKEISANKAKKIIYGISIAIFIVVVVLFQIPKSESLPNWVKLLPGLNAILNGSTSILLLVAIWAVKTKRIAIHKTANMSAFVLSTIFLLSYVAFHGFGVETAFPKDNPIRPVYLFILISHIILAAIVLPLVLLSFYYGISGQIAAHKKITRFSFPIWLYVTITGVIVYLMISPYYPF